MGEIGIYWTKENGELNYGIEPPYPSYNAMGKVANTFTSAYVTQNMAAAFWERFHRASGEISSTHNKLREENRKLRKKVAELELKLSKWTNQSGKGKRPSKKVTAVMGEVRIMKAAGESNREIARRLGVSEGTIRRMLKMSDI